MAGKGNLIGQAYVGIVPTADGISGSIEKAMNGEAEAAGKKSGNKLVSVMKRVIIAAGVGRVVWGAINEGAALQQSIGGIETLYKDSANKMMKYANQAYITSGVSANEYMEQVTSYSAGLISSLGGDTEKAADAANQAMIDMADNANKMGTPIENIQNAYQGFAKQNYTMLDNLKLGYGGTKSEMERLLRDAEKISGVKYDISNLADVYSAIHVIQTEIGITGTTQKEAAETISGSLGMLKAAYKDFLGNLTLGNDVTPQIEALGKSLITVAKNLIPAFANVLIGIPKAIIKNAPQIVGGLKQLVGRALLTWEMNKGEWLSKGVEIVSNVAKGIIENIPVVIMALGKIIYQAAQFVKNNAPAILAAIGHILGNITRYVIANLPAIIKAIFATAVRLIKGAFALVKTAIKTPFVAAWEAVKATFEPITNWFKKKIEQLKQYIHEGLAGVFPIKIGKVLDVKLPHFKVKGGKAPWGLGGLGELPKISIDWYAQGFMTKGTSLIGIGERGQEALVPLDPFWDKLDKMREGSGVTINVYASDNMTAEDVAREVERRLINATKRRGLAWQ